MKIQKHIQIVVTNTDDLDLMSDRTIAAVRASLDEKYQRVEITRIEDENDLTELIQKNPDLVFSGVKFLDFEDKDKKKKRSLKNKIWLSSILKKNGINHTGSETQALKLEINKVKAKKTLSEKGIPTANFFTVVPGQFNAGSILPVEFPLFIKPIYEGGGRGIDENSVIRNFQDFKAKLMELFEEESGEVLVEKYLSGREFTVGILRNSITKELEAFPIELVPQINSKRDSFLDEKAKQEDQELLLLIKEKKVFDRVAQFAKDSFKALGARDYGRIDLRMDRHDRLHFLEANLVPGIGGGYFARALNLVGQISYPKMINSLATLALNRSD